ncbi:MAG: transposase [Candidatus Aminicenantes bacterium]|nr:transposase [Candidatus Aminicenantes bacterium]
MARSLGIENILASQVSEINKGLSVQVESFRNRPLETEYPFVWIDALYEKVRVDSRVIGVFLNRESYVRFITCYFIEYSEDWITERIYIKLENIIIALEARENLLAARAVV